MGMKYLSTVATRSEGRAVESTLVGTAVTVAGAGADVPSCTLWGQIVTSLNMCIPGKQAGCDKKLACGVTC